MSKVILLILGLAIVFLTLLLIVTNHGGKPVGKNPVLLFNPNPSTSTQRELPSTPLSIVSVSPENETTNVPSDQQIQIVFSRPLDLDEIYISFGPGVIFKTALNGNTVSVIPQSPLTTGLTYKLLVKFIKTQQLSNQYQFTVTGTAPVSLPDTQPPGAAKQSEEFNRQNHPDIFLADKTPIKQSSFEFYQGSLKSSPSEHYSFVVVTKADSAKNDLTNKLLSLGLNQDQVNALDLTFVSQDQFNRVSGVKDQLPFYSANVSIGYDKSFDKTTIYIKKINRSEAEQTLADFLKKNEVDSTDWINNLTIIYQ